jgi:hypothetical protein
MVFINKKKLGGNFRLSAISFKRITVEQRITVMLLKKALVRGLWSTVLLKGCRFSAAADRAANYLIMQQSPLNSLYAT